jgi:hypothetical protein
MLSQRSSTRRIFSAELSLEISGRSSSRMILSFLNQSV